MLRKIEGRRRSGGQRMTWLDGITNSIDMNLSQVQRIMKDRKAWHAAGGSNRVLCDNLEGEMEWEVGGRLQREGTNVYLWLIMLMYGRS